MFILAGSLQDSYQYEFYAFSKDIFVAELILVILAVILGKIIATFPALAARKIDISTVLTEES